jgi:hypothetical protein
MQERHVILNSEQKDVVIKFPDGQIVTLHPKEIHEVDYVDYGNISLTINEDGTWCAAVIEQESFVPGSWKKEGF